MDRTVEDVAQAHLDAVASGDVAAMAAHYACDAVLVRGGDVFSGYDKIAAYFATVPERLGDSRVVFDSLRVQGDEAIFEWHLEPSDDNIAGTDVCRIVDGAIVHQVVHLQAIDF